MFLIRSAIGLCIAFMSLLLTTSAHANSARPITHLEDGFYVRTDGVAHLCRPFELPKGMASRSRIDIGYIYSFATENGSSTIENELDRNCEFVETNTRDDFPDATVLTRNNVERCNGKVKSDITTRLTIRPAHLRLELEDKFTDSYFCNWVKATDTRNKK